MRGKQLSQGIGFGRAETERIVAPPAFGVFEANAHFAERAREIIHGAQVGIHALRDVEPGFLRNVRGEREAFAIVDVGRFDEELGDDEFVERAAQAVGHRVVDGDVVGDVFAIWRGAEVRHAAAERGSNGEARSVGVIFHVILRRMGEDDGGGDLPDGGGDFAEERDVVDDFEVIANCFVVCGAEQAGGTHRFFATGHAGAAGRKFDGAAVPAREGHVVNFHAGLFEEEKGAGHVELDVVRMRGDGDGAGVSRSDGNFGGHNPLNIWRKGRDLNPRFLRRP